jgi:hypothetical protein
MQVSRISVDTKTPCRFAFGKEDLVVPADRAIARCDTPRTNGVSFVWMNNRRRPPSPPEVPYRQLPHLVHPHQGPTLRDRDRGHKRRSLLSRALVALVVRAGFRRRLGFQSGGSAPRLNRQHRPQDFQRAHLHYLLQVQRRVDVVHRWLIPFTGSVSPILCNPSISYCTVRVTFVDATALVFMSVAVIFTV